MAWVHIAVVMLSGNSLRQTVHTRRASVHQAVKLVAGLLWVSRVTAGLAESNGSLPRPCNVFVMLRCVRSSLTIIIIITARLMTLVTCRLTAKNRDQLRNPTLGNRGRATFTFFSVEKKARKTKVTETECVSVNRQRKRAMRFCQEFSPLP